MNEPKYQWSKFSGPNRDEQYVVREDTFDDFKKAKEDILDEYFSSPVGVGTLRVAVDEAKATVATAPVSAAEVDEAPEVIPETRKCTKADCFDPGAYMKLREGARGKFYSHGIKLASGEWKNHNEQV